MQLGDAFWSALLNILHAVLNEKKEKKRRKTSQFAKIPNTPFL
jgi:hypothetical protein